MNKLIVSLILASGPLQVANSVQHLENLAASLDEEFAQNGTLLFYSENYAPAWAAYNEAIKLNPKNWLYYYMRAACSCKLEHYRASLLDYKTALSLAKNNEEKGWVNLDLATLYDLMEDEQNAIAHLVTAAKLGNGMAQNICMEIEVFY